MSLFKSFTITLLLSISFASAVLAMTEEGNEDKKETIEIASEYLIACIAIGVPGVRPEPSHQLGIEGHHQA